MSEPQAALTPRAEELRRAFDESFALRPETTAEDVRDFLGIRVGNGRYALPVHDLTGLAGRRKIVPLPSADPALAGLAGVQGRLVPVYRLASLMGAGGGEEELTWLVVCGGEEPVGLAFAALDGHLRVSEANLCAPGPGRRQYECAALREGGEVRFVLDVPAILASLGERAGMTASTSGR
jgi:chemotaxis signal transduction protein